MNNTKLTQFRLFIVYVLAGAFIKFTTDLYFKGSEVFALKDLTYDIFYSLFFSFVIISVVYVAEYMVNKKKSNN